MKNNLDLFGHVPISKYEFQKFIKRNSQVSVDSAIKYIIIKKVIGETPIVKESVHRHGNSINRSLIEFSKICASNETFERFIQPIFLEIHKLIAVRNQRTTKKSKQIIWQEELNNAIQIVHLLSQSKMLQAPIYIGENKIKVFNKLTRAHVKLLHKTHIASETIPWGKAVSSALALAKELGMDTRTPYERYMQDVLRINSHE